MTRLIKQFGGFSHLVRVIARSVFYYGFMETLRRAKRRIHQSIATPDTESILQNTDQYIIKNGPLIGIIVPIYNTPPQFLFECIQSVRQQIYPKWQLILVDDNSTHGDVREIMGQFESQDERIKAVYRKENGNISAAVNEGLRLVNADYFTVLDHDDTISSEALYCVAETILHNPSVDYIYTDEDKLHQNGTYTFGPFYKPDWSPEYMLAMMYTCHMSVFRTALVKELGGYDSEFDGAQDYELTLRVISKTHNIIHIPRVLYHWRVWHHSTASNLDAKPRAFQRQRSALDNYLNALGENFEIHDSKQIGHHEVTFLPRDHSKISIVIPTANKAMTIDGRKENHADAVIDSILSKSTYDNFEIVLVHNGNLTEEQTLKFKGLGVKLLTYDSETFSLAEKINLGCREASGEYLLILNDDIRVITPDWLEKMLGMVQRDGVGVVGAKLLFPDNTIQHAGVVILGGLPGHVYYRQPRDMYGYAMGNVFNRNYIAVTGACQLTPKKLFWETGGYDERYPLNYNDIDYCLKLHFAGFRSVSMANVELYHYEGVSKEGGRTVSEDEINQFLSDWAQKLRCDPYYNPNLNQTTPYGF